LSFVFRILRRFIVKLSPAFQASRNRLYVEFTVRNIASFMFQRNSIRILDVGGSDGSLAKLSYRTLGCVGYEAFVVVLDKNSAELRRGKKLHEFLEYVCGDANHLPFKPRVFDVVCSYSLLEHLKLPWRAVEEMASASEGLCIMQIPNLRYFIEPHTKTPLLFLFPHIVRERIVQITVPDIHLEFSVSYANLTRRFKHAGFVTVSCLRVHHAKWTKVLKIPQGFLLSFQRVHQFRYKS